MLAVLDAGAPMRGARRKVAVVKIVGFDPAFDQGAHQFAEHRRLIVDAAQEHGLAQHGNAGMTRRAQAARASAVSSRAWLACSTTYVALPRALSERTSASVMRPGSTTGMRVCTRMILTCSIAPSALTISPRRAPTAQADHHR